MDSAEKKYQYVNYANGDLLIYEELLKMLPPSGTARFLATHCIGASFDASKLTDLDVYVNYCETTGQFKFIDSELEALRKKIYEASKNIIVLYNDSEPQNKLNQFPSQKRNDHDFMQKVISAHNDFTNAYTELLDTARVKLNVLPALP